MSKEFEIRKSTCPAYPDKLIFMDKEKEKEWESLDSIMKADCLGHLEDYVKKMTQDKSIELLCHVVNDLHERIMKLEKKGD